MRQEKEKPDFNIHMPVFISKALRLASLAVLVFWMLMGCGPDYALEVNGQKISKEEYRKYLVKREKMLKDSGIFLEKENLRQTIREELVIRTILLEEAKRRGISASEEEVKAMSDSIRGGITESEFGYMVSSRGMNMDDFRKDVAEDILVRKLKESFADISDVPLEEVREKYDEMMEKGDESLGFRASLMRFERKGDAEEAYRRLDGNRGHFRKEAMRIDKAGTGAYVTTRWISPKDHPNIAKAAKDVPAGHFTGPVSFNGDWYLVLVEERPQEGHPSFEEAKFEIMASIIEEKREEAFSKWLKEARQGAKVRTNDKNIT